MTRSFNVHLWFLKSWHEKKPVGFQGPWHAATPFLGARERWPASEKKHRRLQDGVLWHKNPWTLASPELGNRSTYHSCHWMLNMFWGFLRILSNMSFWCHLFFLVIISSCSLDPATFLHAAAQAPAENTLSTRKLDQTSNLSTAEVPPHGRCCRV